MFKTRLFWFRKDEGDFADREFKGGKTAENEAAARAYAAKRSNDVSGGLYVLKGDALIAWYHAGEEVTA